jgi:membrane associated rhomboid family serine protease
MTEGESTHTETQVSEKHRFIRSLLFPLVFVVIIWLVKAAEMAFNLEFYTWGLFPQTVRGLRGIFLSPFIHGDFSHLISNTFPILLLGSALFYFYRDVAFRVLILSLMITGVWVWVVGRPSFHIGASGIIYSLAAFLFVSGVIRRHPRLMALSLLVVFLYGGMVWGVFPVQERVSWESHLMGLLSGILLAIYFRAHGPQRKKYSWELEGEPDEYPYQGPPANPGREAGINTDDRSAGNEPEPEGLPPDRTKDEWTGTDRHISTSHTGNHSFRYTIRQSAEGSLSQDKPGKAGESEQG